MPLMSGSHLSGSSSPRARARTETEARLRRRSPEIGGASRGAEPTIVLRGERGFVRCPPLWLGWTELPAVRSSADGVSGAKGDSVHGGSRVKLRGGMGSWGQREVVGEEIGGGEAVVAMEPSRQWR